MEKAKYTPKELLELIEKEGLYQVLDTLSADQVMGPEELKVAMDRACLASQDIEDFEDLLYQLAGENPEEVEDTLDLMMNESLPEDPLMYDPDEGDTD